MDYDTFAALSPLKKPKVWQQLTPENKYEIVTARWRRFLDGNRDRMNPEQIALLETNLAELRPEDYQESRPAERSVWARRSETRFNELFPLEELVRLHFETFMHSGEIRNRIARALFFGRPRFDEGTGDKLLAALYDLATRPGGELPDGIFEILSAAFEDMPSAEEFRALADDEDVPAAAARAYGRVKAARVRNPIALSFRRQKWPLDRIEDVQSALADLATRRPDELRSIRYGDADLPATLGRAFDAMPEGDAFWPAVDDEDARRLAGKMRRIIEMQQSGELPPPGQRR